MPSQTTGDDALSEHDEDEWKRLRSQITFADGIFWLGFVFAPSSYESRIVRERMKSLVEARGKTMHVFVPRSPEELREAIPWLLDPQRNDAGCVWVEAFFVEPIKIDESPWVLSWDHVFLRINNRREVFRTRFKGALVFATPHSIKPRIREVAPDTWSVRALVLELSGGVYPDKSITSVQISPDIVVDLRQPENVPDPDFWKAEAERLPSGTAERANALFQAALGFSKLQQHDQAIVVLSEAANIHRALSKATNRAEYYEVKLASDLRQLSCEQIAMGQFAAALHFAKEAVEISKTVSGEFEPWENGLNLLLGNAFLARAQEELEQPDAALAATIEAIQIATRMSQMQGGASLPILGMLYGAMGGRYHALHDVEKAIGAVLQAVAIFRAVEANRSGQFLLELATSLSQLGSYLMALDRFEEALPFVREGLDVLWPAIEQNRNKISAEITLPIARTLVDCIERAYHVLNISPDPTFVTRKARFAELSQGSS